MSRSSAAGDVRGEREPLLQEERQRRRPSGNPRPTGHDAGDGYEEEGRRDSRGTQHKAAQLSSVIDAHVREQWPIYRVLLVGLFATMGLTGPASAYFNMSRTLSCAEYYEHYPSHALNSVAPFAAAAPSRGDDAATLCNLDAIEESSNTKLLISDVVGSLVSIFAMLFIGPRLSTWGRKPFLLLACACAGVGYLFFAFLPHGYPYGPHASDMPISPTNVARLFVAAGIFANLVGGQTTIMCCLRLMLTDHSSAATKSRNLMLFQLVFYGGIAVGPGLTAILSALFPLSGETMARGLVNLWSHIQKTAPAADSLHHHPTAAMAPSEPMPLPDKGNAEALNVTAFIAASVFMACAFVITVVLHSGMNKVNHPLTRGRDADGSTEALAAQDESHPSRSSEPALLKHVLPKRDALGRLDWRVSVAMIVAMLHLGTGYCFNIYLQFVGHALHWDAESVGFLLSWLGSARVLTLLGLVPLWVAYFERTTRRPPVLRGMTLDEIKAHGSHARADEPPASDASAFAHATPTQVERDAEASTGRDEREEHQMEKELDGAVAIWRAQVDRRLLALSWSLDVVGWLLVAAATYSKNAAAIIAGGFFIALGAASNSSRQSVDLTIFGDVFARAQANSRVEEAQASDPLATASTSSRMQGAGAENGHEAPHSSAQDAPVTDVSDVYFALIGIFEAGVTTVAPLLWAYIYRNTLSSFPAANSLGPALLFVLAMMLHFSMPMHKE